MRRHRNQPCPIYHSLFCRGREQVPKEQHQREMGVRRGEDSHHPRGYRKLRSNGENFSTGRLLPRRASVHSAKRSSPIMPMSSPTTSVLAALAVSGGTATRTTFRLSTGGAVAKWDRLECDQCGG
jgi:hypothetical protein